MPHRQTARTAGLASTVAAALCLAVPASAAVPNGTYRGDTNQNRAVHAKVKKGKLKRLSFSVFLRCGVGGSGGSITDALHETDVPLGPGGSFRVSSEGDSANGRATYELVGKVKKGKVTGSVEQFFRNGCQAFELTFTAKRK